MRKSINILLLLAVAGFSLWCTGDLMRKNDQAAILAGAYDLANGRMQDAAAYYQFDKTYVLYWVCAAVLKIFSGMNSPVVVANVSLALIFWSALTVFVVCFRKTLPVLTLLCFLTAPPVLFNTLYVNSSVLSSSFLLLSAVFFLQPVPRGGWPAALFFALAVGSRADVILLLPLLLWLATPFSMLRDFPAGFSGQVKIIAAGLLALVTGRILCPGGASFDPIFNWKMVAGYAVFGFGAAGLLFMLYSVRLTVSASKGHGAFEKLYGLAGLGAFLLPVFFFLLQLHTPRYFWRGCEAVLLLSVSRCLPVWNPRPVQILLGLTAALPLFAGMQLPALNRPRVTVTQPTLFPSGDGFYPMGGALSFMLRLRNTTETPVDHNQMVWAALQQASFYSDDHQSIRVLYTPMFGYFSLAASMRGVSVEKVFGCAELSNGCFYADSRSLMRDDPKTPIKCLDELLSLPVHFVSPLHHGVGVLEFGAGDDRWGRQTRLLNRLFSGSEYRVFCSGLPDCPDRKTVFFSDLPFKNAQRDTQTGLYYSDERIFCSTSGVFYASAILPEWMSVRAFKGNGQ